MKKLFLLFVFAALGSIQTASADVINAIGSFFKTPQSYEKTGFGVEVLNKTGKKIWVVPINATDLKGYSFQYDRTPIELKPKGFFEDGNVAFKTDINQQTALAIWTQKPTESLKVSRNTFKTGTWKVTPKPDWYVEFTKGKTSYVTVDKNGVRPQTGPREGKAGMTDSGLSLKDNVTVGDIKIVQ